MYDEEQYFNEREIELLDDAIKFFKLIGGADELSDRGWRIGAIMDTNYMETIEELADKWLMGVVDGYDDCTCILKTDDCLEVEEDLNKYFRAEILEKMSR